MASKRIDISGPGGCAHRGEAAGVVPDRDLNLHAREPGRRGRGGLARRPGSVGRRDRRVDGRGRRGVGAEEPPHRLPRAATLEVPEREVHGRDRLGDDGRLNARRAQWRKLAPVGVRQQRPAVLERRADVVDGGAVVPVQRRGLAVGDGAVVGLEADEDQRPGADGVARGDERRAQARLMK